MKARVFQLRAETEYRKGSEVISVSLGRCRVREIRGDQVSVVAAHKPIGAEPDAWCKVDKGVVIDPHCGEQLSRA